MQVPVSLGGHVASWRFEGTQAFEDWVADGDWIDEGGIRLLRVPSARHHNRFSEASLSALVASDYGRGIRTFKVDAPSLVNDGEALESTFLRLIGVDQHQNIFKGLLDAARSIEGRPAVFLVQCHKNTAAVVTECEQFVERIEKVGGYNRPTIVCMISEDTSHLHPCYVFQRGFPVHLQILSFDLEPSIAWRKYVHLRIAWETCGDLGMSETWESRYDFREIPSGNDDLLEKALNHAATEQFRLLCNEMQSRLMATLDSYFPLCEGQISDIHEFISNNLVRKQNGTVEWVIAPWVARAMLQTKRAQGLSPKLRANLRCDPLTSELLLACFALESRERLFCHRFMPHPSDANDDTQRLLAEFLENPERSIRKYYPMNCPALDVDVWQFASLGEIIAKSTDRPSPNRKRARHVLRIIRNALAHGHYPSWRMVIELKGLVSILS